MNVLLPLRRLSFFIAVYPKGPLPRFGGLVQLSGREIFYSNKGFFLRLLILFISVISSDAFGQQDKLLIPKFIAPKNASLRQIDKPQVRWLVKNSAQEICRLELNKDGYSQLEEGCVFWSIDKKQCTLVTSNYTSHALLGELFMKCLEGN
jgi:hypothetical protein